MSVVGSLIFCLECGNLLDNPSSTTKDHIECSQCEATYPKKNFANLKVKTSTAPDAFPSKLSAKKSVVKTSLKKGELDGSGAIIKEKCPKCGNDEMQYHTLQLRSADEGATVFYTCTKCGYKTRTNN
ncbi:DNA-directed RNA polymerase I core subunit rpa12 [Hanseniaspora vineae]|uniref:DNA-directed RNA polymerase subunit n=1 Tax=Hanseniaspora osmophila TaxID=56408 RepID=A0A1E5RAL4_9ASCO|nr:DNA-directed RNA polymerase I subunit RPA12 [Hanseniaspora osmophila]